jgi:hypothetical protein
VAVSEAVSDFLEESYFDCLCKNCLQDLNQKMAAIEQLDFPQSSELVENLHFYMDGNRFVFTEIYFLLRGHCCRSNCRHCPYGFNNT